MYTQCQLWVFNHAHICLAPSLLHRETQQNHCVLPPELQMHTKGGWLVSYYQSYTYNYLGDKGANHHAWNSVMCAQVGQGGSPEKKSGTCLLCSIYPHNVNLISSRKHNVCFFTNLMQIMLPVLDNNHWTDMEVWIFNSIAGSGNKICTYVVRLSRVACFL